MSISMGNEDEQIARARELEELCARLLVLESLVEISSVYRSDPETFEHLLRDAAHGLFARADRLRALDLLRYIMTR